MSAQVITPQQFVFDIPLYQEVEFDQDFIEQFVTDNRSRFDGYNPDEKCESTYELIEGFGVHPLDYKIINQEPFVLFNLLCTRKKSPLLILVKVDWESNKICKVGQTPSIASMHIAQVHQYDKVLDKHDMKDLTRAIGLAANGIGIGSFVYLRRIFERLIQDVVNKMIVDGSITQEQFDKSRMDEKITLIKSELPPFIVEQRSIYGIISKGIHQLSEEECLAMFDVMRISIELILDEKLEQYNKEKKIKQVKASINTYAAKLK